MVAGAVIVVAEPQARARRVQALPVRVLPEQAPLWQVRQDAQEPVAGPPEPVLPEPALRAQVQVSRQLRGAAEAVVAGALSHPRQY